MKKEWPLKSIHISVTCILFSVLFTGCVSGNKAEVSAIRIEKQSKAEEVDQYVETSGKVLRFIGIGK